MCSNLEEAEIDCATRGSSLTAENIKCKRCDNMGEVILRGTDSYCSGCFIIYISHKFCSTIGKMRAVRHGDKVLIAFSGGLSSRVMVHLVNESIQKAGAQRRLMFQPTVLFISDPGILEPIEDSREKQLTEVIEVCKNHELPLVWCYLEDYLTESPTVYGDNEQFIPPVSDKIEALQALFQSVKTLTAKEDLMQRIKTELISKVAQKCNHPKVFVGTNCSRLATTLLTSVAQGRGAQLPLEVGFSDTHFEGVTIIRPMRELLEEELEKFVTLTGLHVPRQKMALKEGSRLSSIGRLTHDFLTTLQKDFPGTIPTVFRTGDKLSGNYSSASKACTLCKMTIDNAEIPPSSALQAKLYSGALSKLGKTATAEEVEALRLAPPTAHVASIDRTNLCYGCSLTINDCT